MDPGVGKGKGLVGRWLGRTVSLVAAFLKQQVNHILVVSHC